MYCFAFLIVTCCCCSVSYSYVHTQYGTPSNSRSYLAQVNVFLARFASNPRSMPILRFSSPFAVRQRLKQIFRPDIPVPFHLCYEEWFPWEFVGSMEPEEEKEGADDVDIESSSGHTLSPRWSCSDVDFVSTSSPDGIDDDT